MMLQFKKEVSHRSNPQVNDWDNKNFIIIFHAFGSFNIIYWYIK
jgi:hypothetical protein